MEKCPHCTRQFKTKQLLTDHILNEHVAGGETALSITPEVCTELGITQTEFDVIQSTLAPGASPNELMYFLNAARTYGLDPIKKELYFSKLGGKVTLLLSRDGYLAMAHRQPSYRGMHSATVCANDDFTLSTDVDENGAHTQSLKHVINAFSDRGDVIGAWCRVDVADQAPVFVIVRMGDYNKNTPVWKQYPSAMIAKCAESMALKRVVGASGAVSMYEIADDNAPEMIQADLLTEMRQ